MKTMLLGLALLSSGTAFANPVSKTIAYFGTTAASPGEVSLHKTATHHTYRVQAPAGAAKQARFTFGFAGGSIPVVLRATFVPNGAQHHAEVQVPANFLAVNHRGYAPTLDVHVENGWVNHVYTGKAD